MENLERLQKVIAAAGVASRRKAEELITTGVVKVNGKKVTELGTKVTPTDKIEVNGIPIIKENHVYLLMNKPRGCVTTVKDEFGRTTVIDLLGTKVSERVYPNLTKMCSLTALKRILMLRASSLRCYICRLC